MRAATLPTANTLFTGTVTELNAASGLARTFQPCGYRRAQIDNERRVGGMDETPHK